MKAEQESRLLRKYPQMGRRVRGMGGQAWNLILYKADRQFPE